MAEPRYVFEWSEDAGKYLLLDTQSKVARRHWEYSHGKLSALVPKDVASVCVSIMPYCCGVTEVGGFWTYSEKELTEEQVEVFCQGLMDGLNTEKCSLAVCTFASKEEEILNEETDEYKFTYPEGYEHKNIMDCLIKDHGWVLLREYRNRKYAEGHNLATITRVFTEE